MDSRRLVDTYALAAFLGIPPATLRSWAHRGKITRRGTSPQGWALYDAAEVAGVAAARRKQSAAD